MDDPGTLIYVAFLVISLIVGWIRNKKKNAEQAANSTEQEPSEAFSKQDIANARIKQLNAEKDAQERLRELISKPIVESKISRKRSLSKELKSRDRVQNIEEIEEEEVSFDARKAFIYSEIFNAPYI